MSEEAQLAPDRLSDRDERHIQRDLDRKRELEDALRRFHEQVRVSPEIWKDSGAAGDALRQVFELRAVDYELHLLYLRQLKRAQRREVEVGPADSPAPPADLDPVLPT